MADESIPHICLVTFSRLSEITYGGIEQFVMYLVPWLRRNGFQVSLLGRGLARAKVIDLPDSLDTGAGSTDVAPLRILQLPHLIFRLGLPAIAMLLLLLIVRVNKTRRITLIHAQDTGYAGLASVLAGKLLNVPVILTSHGVRYETLRHVAWDIVSQVLLPFEYWLDCYVARRATFVICISDWVRNYFRQMGIHSHKLAVIPSGIDVPRFARAGEYARAKQRKNLGLDSEHLAIGFVGRFSAEKNVKSLIEAFAIVAQKIPHARLVLVGGGPLETSLREQAQRIGIDRKVIFTGPRKDVENLLAAFDIFVLPSLVEGLSMSLLEAMASQKAIVASNIPAIRSLVRSGNSAVLVDPYDISGMSNEITNFCRDEKARAAFGMRAYRDVMPFDVQYMFPRLARIYNGYGCRRASLPRL